MRFIQSFRCAALLGVVFAILPLLAQEQTSRNVLEITGTVKSGNMPLPGVTITASAGTTKFLTSTDFEGNYALAIGAEGEYTITAQLAGFAAVSKEIALSAANPHAHLDVELTLQSRVRVLQPGTAEPGRQQAGAQSGNAPRGFQSLALTEQTGTQGQQAPNGFPDIATLQGMSGDAPTESVAVSGGRSGATEFQNMNSEEIQRRMEEMGMRGDAFGAGPGGDFSPGGRAGASGMSGMRPGMQGPGGSGGFGGRGGPGRPGGGPMLGGARFGRFNANQPHGSLSYSLSDSIFDAAPYSITGAPAAKPDYAQHRYSAMVGGPLSIPKLYKGDGKTFFTVNYNGSRSRNPYDVFSTVPTLLERSGDFSATRIRTGASAGQLVTIINPATGLPFTDNKIPVIDPAALGLLTYIPLPNLPGDSQNFHYVTANASDSDAINLRIIHTFGLIPARTQRNAGSRGAGGGRGGFGRRSANNLNFGLRYSRSSNVLTNPFPTLGGHAENSGLDVPIGYTRTFGRLTNSLRVDYNRSRTASQNLFAFVTDVTGQLGIAGVSQDPFDWGVPGVSFTNYAGLRDSNPMLRRNQTLSFSDDMSLVRGKHLLRWGADFRRLQINTKTDSNARGSFVFAGAFSGLDFADFLLGLPAQASVQYGQNAYYFRGNSWDAYFQDNWQVRSNLTLNLGLRYEYISPFHEKYGHIVNLDTNAGITAVAPVLPGAIGPYTGAFTSSLMNPDRNNFAPRIGIAWRARKNTVVRTGYGVNYNTGAYSAIVQQLAFQPPFTFTATNSAALVPITLRDAFPTLSPDQITNNFGADRNYRLGYVQIWNLDVQQQLGRGLMLNTGYTGTKGTGLDMLRAPNRNPDGTLRIAGAQAFLWESAQGASVMHAATVRLRRRLQRGLSVGGTYVFSKSIDNASSIGGAGTGIVAQNDQDLAAERGLSSFDQRHRFTADYSYEFPFGVNKRWLSTGRGSLARIFGDWQWSGNMTIASGTPLTVRILGAATDINTGVNGTLRPDLTGQPLTIAHPGILAWFNTAAFTMPYTIDPATGQCVIDAVTGQCALHPGDAGRNIIIGPGTVNFGMALSKTVPLGEMKALEIRAQATNVFNTPQFSGVDTTLNSRTFGRITSVSSMRKVQLVTRFRF